MVAATWLLISRRFEVLEPQADLLLCWFSPFTFRAPDVEILYRHAMRLWLIVPLLLLWILRVWLKASRGELDDDPVIFALRDKMSLAIGAAVAVIALFAL